MTTHTDSPTANRTGGEPCPYVYAGGRPCAGHIVDFQPFKTKARRHEGRLVCSALPNGIHAEAGHESPQIVIRAVDWPQWRPRVVGGLAHRHASEGAQALDLALNGFRGDDARIARRELDRAQERIQAALEALGLPREVT